MKLIEYNREKVTVEMAHEHFSQLCDVLRTVAVEYSSLDREILMVSEEEIIKLRDELFAAQEEGLARAGIDIKAALAGVMGSKKPK